MMELATLRSITFTNQHPKSFPSSLRLAWFTWSTHQNGRWPTVSLFRNQANHPMPTRSPTSLFRCSPVLGNCWSQLWPEDLPARFSDMVPPTPSKWVHSQEIMQWMHSSVPLLRLPLPLARRRLPRTVHCVQLFLHTTSKGPSTRSTHQHCKKLCSKDVCQCT